MNPTQAPKIHYLLPELKLGGAEKHVIRLAAGLRKKGYEVGITCLFREGALAEEARGEGIPLVCLNLPYRWGPATFLSLRQWLLARRPDILHTYLFGFHFFAGLPARLLKVPVIVSSRREIAGWQKKRHRMLESLGNFFVDRVVCCSKAVEEWTLKKEYIQPERLVTLHNGVDMTRFNPSLKNPGFRRNLGIPVNAFVVGTVANIAIEKGYPYLLEAAEQILRENPRLWFLFVGFGPLEKEMKERARQIKGCEQIIFSGARSDIPELMREMDLFVLASIREGFPNVLLEVMAMGKPVVATDVGGIPELIESGTDGLLVPAKNGEALAEALRSLLKDPEKAGALGRSGQEKIRNHFSLDRMVEQYEALYLSLLREKGAKTPLETCAAL